MTKQAPESRGRAISKTEKLAYQGLLARQRELEQMGQALRVDHDELLGEIEDRLNMPNALLGDSSKGKPPTHTVDQSSWNVVKVETPETVPDVPPPLPARRPAAARKRGTGKRKTR